MTDPLSFYRVTSADPEVDRVLHRHHVLMRSQSPAESGHAMTADALRRAGARVFAAKQGGHVLAVGAFKQFSETSVEIKSMHTVAEARGQGIGRKMIRTLLDEARKIGASHAFLETGSYAAFAPARAFYETVGFNVTDPFGDYRADPLSTFMHLTL